MTVLAALVLVSAGVLTHHPNNDMSRIEKSFSFFLIKQKAGHHHLRMLSTTGERATIFLNFKYSLHAKFGGKNFNFRVVYACGSRLM